MQPAGQITREEIDLALSRYLAQGGEIKVLKTGMKAVEPEPAPDAEDSHLASEDFLEIE